jgi:RTX calcium-binding nonapeptide repeat (4 copies)
VGGAGDDRMVGGAGNDKESGNAGADELTGGSGDDVLVADYLNVTSNGTKDVPDGKVDAISCGDGNDTAFISVSDGDTAAEDCEKVNPTSFQIPPLAQALKNATENLPAIRPDLETGCTIISQLSKTSLSTDECKKIEIALNESASPSFLPLSNESKTTTQLQTAGQNSTTLCGDILSNQKSDDVAVDICNYLIQPTNQSSSPTNAPSNQSSLQSSNQSNRE